MTVERKQIGWSCSCCLQAGSMQRYGSTWIVQLVRTTPPTLHKPNSKNVQLVKNVNLKKGREAKYEDQIISTYDLLVWSGIAAYTVNLLILAHQADDLDVQNVVVSPINGNKTYQVFCITYASQVGLPVTSISKTVPYTKFSLRIVLCNVKRKEGKWSCISPMGGCRLKTAEGIAQLGITNCSLEGCRMSIEARPGEPRRRENGGIPVRPSRRSVHPKNTREKTLRRSTETSFRNGEVTWMKQQ